MRHRIRDRCRGRRRGRGLIRSLGRRLRRFGAGCSNQVNGVYILRLRGGGRVVVYIALHGIILRGIGMGLQHRAW
jgi:hypothetical protein